MSSAERDATAPPSRWNAGFDERPEDYDRLRAAGHMARRRLEHFTQVVDRVPGTVLEIGTGTGTLLSALAERRPDRTFLGVEPLANYVEFANERASGAGRRNVRFIAGTAEDVAELVEPGSVGLVMSVDTLHHVQDVDRVVRGVHRVVAPGGRWHAMEPNRLHPYVWTYQVLVPGERTLPAPRYRGRPAAAGWELCERSRLFLFPSGVQQLPPRWERLERRWERVPVLAGAVTLELAPR
jgi:SAM-dependent methyltransferase